MTDFKPFDSANKVLITGAAGFIGFHLAKRLLAMGATILGLDNLNDYYDVSLKESWIFYASSRHLPSSKGTWLMKKS